MKKTTFIAIAFTFVMFSCADKNPVLTVEGGQIQGIQTQTQGVYVYRGIPYAAAPTGELRWKEPQPVTPWEGVRVADEFCNACMQAAHREGEFYQKEFFDEGDAPYSEDCLFLNVWTPAPGKVNKKLPVAMWIHGGGYSAGWGFEKEMDGEAWAERGVVLVTINYRLNIFGFLAHPSLTAESPHKASGNYGILDQIAALHWIKDNIAQFGGDPGQIMIFGQSAGAGSVQTLVASPLAKPLISKAIIMSGGGVSERPMMGGGDLEDAAQRGKELMDWAGYDNLEKMRAASAKDIFEMVRKYAAETGQRAPFSPIIDGYVSDESFSSAVLANRVADVPYMIGSVMDDIPFLGNSESIGTFCTEREKAGNKAYAYQFARPLPGDDAGAYHSSELWYIFQTLDRAWRPFTEEDKVLSNVMVDAWTNFARFNDPNGAQGGVWTPYASQSPEYMIFKLDSAGREASSMGQPLPSSRSMNFGSRQ